MRKILTCLLALTLVLAMCPQAAFAGFDYETSNDGKWVFTADYYAKTCTIKGITADNIKASGGDIVFPEKINGLKVTEIDTNWKTGYSDQTKVVSATIPDSVTSIGNSAFKHMTALKKITFADPAKITKMGTGLFTECHALEEFTMPPKIKKVPNNTFSFCNSLKNVKLAKGTTEIGEYAFAHCEALTDITIPSTVKTIKYNAFFETGLTSVYLPNAMKKIYDNTFLKCRQLKSVRMPAYLEEIGHNAFEGCESLERVTIPTSCNTIWGRAFRNCPNLTTAVVRGNPEIYRDAFEPTAKLTVFAPSPSKVKDFCEKDKIAFRSLNPPKWVSKTRTATTVTLKWKTVSGAAEYKVYKKTGSGSYKLVKTTAGTSYKGTGLKKGVTYKYYVVTVKKDALGEKVQSKSSTTYTTYKKK